MVKKTTVIAGMVALLAGSGCVYSHRVVNTGTEPLYSVSVHAGEQSFGHGVLSANKTSGYTGSMKISRNPSPVVSWRPDPAGVETSRVVELPFRPAGREIVFELDGKTVKAHPLRD